MSKDPTTLDEGYLAELRERYFDRNFRTDPEYDMATSPIGDYYLHRELNEEDLPVLALELNRLRDQNRILRNSDDAKVFFAEQKVQKIREWCQYESTRPGIHLAAKAAYALVLTQIGEDET